MLMHNQYFPHANKRSKMEDNELNSSIASYLPDRYLITFSPAMAILSKEDQKSRGLTGVREISYFFHEWIHYLHNISTVHGVSSFCSLLGMWSAFRWTSNEHGIGSGKIDHESPESFKVSELMKFMESARTNGRNKPPSGTCPDGVEVKNYKKREASINGGASVLSLSISYSNQLGDENNLDVMFGPGEILESVAYLLEQRFLERLAKQKSEAADVVPYHLLSIFSRYIAPSLSREDALLCALTSLQCTDPIDFLIKLLKECDRIDPADEGRVKFISKVATDQIEFSKETVNHWLHTMEEMFPVDEAMGLAIKNIICYMRRNFEIRAEQPFFEINIIEELGRNGAGNFARTMDALMAKHGICSGKQQFFGGPDELMRDVLFEFAVAGQDKDINEGRRIMQASFDFIFRHFSKDGDFLPTSKARKGPCPFYTSCDSSPRINTPEICKNTPWATAISDIGSPCWYADGVIKLRPGEDVEIS